MFYCYSVAVSTLPFEKTEPESKSEERAQMTKNHSIAAFCDANARLIFHYVLSIQNCMLTMVKSIPEWAEFYGDVVYKIRKNNW